MDDPELIKALTRIEAKLDYLADTYSAHLKDHDDHEERIRSLEKKVWTLPSMATLLAVLAIVLPFLLA
jgi:cell division septum initiation protein DivIVA